MGYLFKNRDLGREIKIDDPASALALAATLADAGGWVMATPDGKEVALGSVQMVSKPTATAVEPPQFKPQGRAEKTTETRAVKREPQTKSEERRKHVRQSKKFRVLLVAGNRTFRSYSRDISMGGIKLENPLPSDFMAGEKECLVLVGGNHLKHNLQFHCELIPDHGDLRRLKFKPLDQSCELMLSQWLNSEPSHRAA